MRSLWLLVLVVPFFIPAHFYPIPTYPEELIVAVLVTAIGTVAVITSKHQIRVNTLLIWWFVMGMIWLISWFFNQKNVVSGAFFYQLFWVLGVFALMGAAGLNETLGKAKLIQVSARTLVFAGFLYAAMGLFGYYGGLKFVVPWLSSDQSRLVGIMAHPNLSGLYLAISLAAFGFFIYIRKHRLFEFRSLVFVLVVCLAGVLTGSRAFFVIVFAQLLLTSVWVLGPRRGERSSEAFIPAALKYQLLVAVVSVALFFAYPPIDSFISEKLTEGGVLNRQSSSEMLAERYNRTEQPRLGEWRKIIEGTEVIDNVWVGVGPGAYSEFSVAADDVIENPFRNGKTWRNAHNIFLMAFVEWGIIGSAFIAAFFIFLIICFFKAERNSGNYFVWLALGAILTHNLVEFSLWHLQFLVLFLVLLSTQTKNVSLKLTSPSLRWVVVIPVALLTVWMSTTSTRDFFKMVDLFAKADVGEEDVRTLDLIAQNSLWRPYARMVMYYRLNPYATGIENQLKEATAIADWSPGNLVLMRQASLTAALGKEELACERIARATELYPAIIPTLEEELIYLDSQGAPFDLGKMMSCFSDAGTVAR
tara:strand:- start:947 stop:2713 length:1767 start_codon:yes stop_codon:yes gene_type:complete